MDKNPQRSNESSGAPGDEVIIATRAGHLVPVARSQVRWAEADGDYVRLHTTKGTYLASEPLRCLAKRWAEHGFVRIHRSHMVFLPLVTELRRVPSGHSVRLGSGPDFVDVPVSRRKLKELKQRWTQDQQP